MAQVLVDGRTVQVNDCAVEILSLKLKYDLQVECGNNVQKKLRFVRCLLKDNLSPAKFAAVQKVKEELEVVA